MRFSIVMPVYNAEKYLETMILSILNQTYEDFELLLINDGSTDQSLNICKKYEKQDHRVRVFQQENKGASAARNIGITNAKGQYIQMVDSDDYIEVNALEEVARNIDNFAPDVLKIDFVVVAGDVKKKIICGYPHNILLDRPYMIENVIPPAIGIHDGDIVSAHVTFFIKTSLLREHNILYDESKRKEEDHPFIVQVLAVAQSIVFVNGCFYHYLKHSNSLISRYSPRFKNICENFALYERLFQGIYDFNSQEKIRYNINVLIECCYYVFGHYKECNVKSEILSILKSEESRQWFLMLEPFDNSTKTLKKLVCAKKWGLAYIHLWKAFVFLRTNNFRRKCKKRLMRR